MGKVTGFLEFERLEEGYEPVEKRLKNYKEFVIGLTPEESKIQGARMGTSSSQGLLQAVNAASSDKLGRLSKSPLAQARWAAITSSTMWVKLSAK